MELHGFVHVSASSIFVYSNQNAESPAFVDSSHPRYSPIENALCFVIEQNFRVNLVEIIQT